MPRPPLVLLLLASALAGCAGAPRSLDDAGTDAGKDGGQDSGSQPMLETGDGGVDGGGDAGVDAGQCQPDAGQVPPAGANACPFDGGRNSCACPATWAKARALCFGINGLTCRPAGLSCAYPGSGDMSGACVVTAHLDCLDVDGGAGEWGCSQ